MAKKQKKVITNSENTEAKELISTQINSLAYQGKIKVQIMHGNKIISTKQYQNKGLPELFRYIGYALAGFYYPALRPCKLALFFNQDTAGDKQDPNTFKWEDAFGKKTLVEVSPYVIYDATPVVTNQVVNGVQTITTTFRFKIPFNWLYKKSFNVIGLFNETNAPCAYYLCTADKGDGSGNLKWQAENLSDITGNFSLIIEWAMEVSNK